MEEMRQKLRVLEKMTHELDCICGLVYVLKDAICENEDELNVHYSMASFYISEQLNNFKEKLDMLLEDLFDAFRNLKPSA
ncbi:hypothetical protein [Anaerotignum sp.]